jgi:hypothetical protein
MYVGSGLVEVGEVSIAGVSVVVTITFVVGSSISLVGIQANLVFSVFG